MKKFVLLLIISIFLFGCGKSKAEKRLDTFMKNITNDKILIEIPHVENKSIAFGEILKKNSYKITKIILDEKIGFAYIDIKLKMVNLSYYNEEFAALYLRSSTKQTSKDLAYTLRQFFDKKLKKDEPYFVERDIKIIMSKDRDTGKWGISNPEEVLNLMTDDFFD